MSVVALFHKPPESGLDPVEELEFVAGSGIVADRYFGTKTRQVLALSTATLEQHGYEPGDLREHIVVDFAKLQTLAPGTRVQIGEVEFSVEQLCAPCPSMAQRLGEEPKEFVTRMLKDRGIFLLTESSGRIKLGDPVKVLDV